MRGAQVEDPVQEYIDDVTVLMGDTSHREKGWWAVDSSNPNAWPGAADVISSTTADFTAFQETRVEAEETKEREETMKKDMVGRWP